MKRILMAALIAAQAIVAVPVPAAELDSRSPFLDNQRGVFAGVRLRANLGGKEQALRAGLAMAPTSHSRRGTNARTAMAEGLELSVSPSNDKPVVTLAGQQLDRMTLFGRPPEKEQANLSTIATVAIVAGVVVVVGALAFVHVVQSNSCFHGDDRGGC